MTGSSSTFSQHPLLLLALLAAAATLADAARLVAVPLASPSHIAAFTALTTALEQHGGHEVYMVCPAAGAAAGPYAHAACNHDMDTRSAPAACMKVPPRRRPQTFAVLSSLCSPLVLSCTTCPLLHIQSVILVSDTQVVSEGLLEPSKGMAAARNASHRHSYLTYPLQYDLFPKDMADLAKANSIRAMAIGYKVLAAMTDMVIGNTQLLQVRGWVAGWLGVWPDGFRVLAWPTAYAVSLV